jgi:hypothetical protein
MPRKQNSRRTGKNVGRKPQLASPFRDFRGTPLPCDGRGVPVCPGCLAPDYVHVEGEPAQGNAWCGRCCGWLATLEPPPGRYVPDFI